MLLILYIDLSSFTLNGINGIVKFRVLSFVGVPPVLYYIFFLAIIFIILFFILLWIMDVILNEVKLSLPYLV